MTNQLKIRNLRGDDVFSVLELVNRLDLIDPIQSILTGDKRKEIMASFDATTVDEINDQEVGFEILVEVSKLVVVRLPKARNEINTFIADITDSDIETIKNLSIKQYIDLVKDFFKHPDLEELFKSLGELIKSE